MKANRQNQIQALMDARVQSRLYASWSTYPFWLLIKYLPKRRSFRVMLWLLRHARLFVRHV